MIIKSMSRKSPTFDQLIDYINSEKSDERFNVYHNVYARNFEQLKREFEQNSERLARRKNGVYLYHEILSITRAKGISEKRQKEIFCQLAQEYAQGRAGQNMVYAGMHDDKQHNLHYHFVISSNSVNESKRLRLSKAEFATFKQDFEKMVLQKYPELEQEVIIQKGLSTRTETVSKLSNKGGELKRRTGKTPQREKVIEMLNGIFEKSFSVEDMIRQLDEQGYDFYIRGKNPGVSDRSTGRKCRLKTLGLIDQLESLDDAAQQAAKPSSKKAKKSPAGEKEKEISDGDAIQQHSDSVKSENKGSPNKKKDDAEEVIDERRAQIKKLRQAKSDAKLDDGDKQKR